MKLDAMTGAAMGFAAFATWFALRQPKGPTSATGSDVAFGQARRQREEVGANTSQNLDWILTGVTPSGFVPNANGVPRTAPYSPFEG